MSRCLCRLSCDKRVVMQMSGRTLGNSATSLRSYLVEQHTAAWCKRVIAYYSIYGQFVMPGVTVPPPLAIPEMELVPTSRWVLSAYIADSFSRLGEMRAKVTSVFGTIIKMGSTKKVQCYFKSFTMRAS